MTSVLPMQRPLPANPRRRVAASALALLAVICCGPGASAQQSALLESVKQNPQRGKDLCLQLRQLNAQQLNAQGQSFTSAQVTTAVARQENLSAADAEVLVTYVVGFYCPDVR